MYLRERERVDAAAGQIEAAEGAYISNAVSESVHLDAKLQASENDRISFEQEQLRCLAELLRIGQELRSKRIDVEEENLRLTQLVNSLVSTWS